MASSMIPPVTSARSVQIENTSTQDQTICKDMLRYIMWTRTKMTRNCGMFWHRDRRVAIEVAGGGSDHDIMLILWHLLLLCALHISVHRPTTGSDAIPSFSFSVFLFLYDLYRDEGLSLLGSWFYISGYQVLDFAPFYGIGVLILEWAWACLVRIQLDWVGTGL
jgi:hypothetical protein